MALMFYNHSISVGDTDGVCKIPSEQYNVTRPAVVAEWSKALSQIQVERMPQGSCCLEVRTQEEIPEEG